MKKIILILLAICAPQFLSAQEPLKTKEVGVVYNTFNGLGLSFKSGTDKSLWRFNTLIISGNNFFEQTSDNVESKLKGFGFEVSFGKELRKSIIENLTFFGGADLSLSYQYSKSDKNDLLVNNNDLIIKSITFEPGVKLVIGLNYSITEKIIIGAEVLPLFSYYKNTTEVETNGVEDIDESSKYRYGISNTSALLLVSYKF